MRFLSGKDREHRRKQDGCVTEAVDGWDERIFRGQRARTSYERDGSMMHFFVCTWAE